MDSQPVCERNLVRLRRRHPRLAAVVAGADRAGIERVEGPRGAATLAERGRLLGSAYDPSEEGRRQAAALAEGRTDLVVSIGFGLGHHLESLLREQRAPVLVYEPSPARLRAALESLGERTWLDVPALHWAADLDELGERFAALYTPGLAVRFFVHPSVQALDPKAARAAADRIARAKDTAELMANTRALMMETWAALAIENAPHLVATPGLAPLVGAFAGVPAVVAAAGPSLERQLDTLARLRDRVLLIAIGQALPALRAAGIEPDLVHVIESKNVAHQLVRGGPSDELALVLLPSTHPGLFELPVRARFVSTPVTQGLSCWIARALGETCFVPGGATVAQSAVHLAHALGADPILLIGQDLAFTGGRVYARGSAYDMVSLRERSDGSHELAGLAEKASLFGFTAAPKTRRADLVWVEGWDGKPVATSRSYAAFRESYRRIGAYLVEKGVRLVNCTEGGARIPGLEHGLFAEILERLPARAIDARARIDRAWADAPRPGASALEQPIADARRALDALERQARAGAKAAQAAIPMLARAPGAQREALRRVVRAERRVQEALDELPWLDQLTERARLVNEATVRRADARCDARAGVEEEQRLFDATEKAVRRGRALLDRLEERLGLGERGEAACARGAA